MTSVNSAADVTYGADAANRIVWNWQHQRRGTLQTIIEATPKRRHSVVHLRDLQCMRRERSSPRYNTAPAGLKTVKI